MIGYIYIAQNKSFREDLLKIGLCSNINNRMKSLSNSSVPLDYTIIESFEVNDAQKAEKMVFEALVSKKYRKEFYVCSIDEAISACKKVQQEINMPIGYISKKQAITIEQADNIANMWLYDDMWTDCIFDN